MTATSTLQSAKAKSGAALRWASESGPAYTVYATFA